MTSTLCILRREIDREHALVCRTLESAWKRGWALTAEERATVRVSVANHRAAVLAYCRLADGHTFGRTYHVWDLG